MVYLFSKPVPSYSRRKALLQGTLSPVHTHLTDPVPLLHPVLLATGSHTLWEAAQAASNLPAATRSQGQWVQSVQEVPQGRRFGRADSPAPFLASPIPFSESLLSVFIHPPVHQWKAYFSSTSRHCVLGGQAAVRETDWQALLPQTILEGSGTQSNQGTN